LKKLRLTVNQNSNPMPEISASLESLLTPKEISSQVVYQDNNIHAAHPIKSILIDYDLCLMMNCINICVLIEYVDILKLSIDIVLINFRIPL
jgi:hypothetical protein